MLGLRQRTPCRQKFKKLQIVTLPIFNSFETVIFIVKNPDNFQNNVSNLSRDMRQITDFIYNQ